jgi:hypothetical protein
MDVLNLVRRLTL